jgi:hypothetical protein
MNVNRGLLCYAHHNQQGPRAHGMPGGMGNSDLETRARLNFAPTILRFCAEVEEELARGFGLEGS